MTQLVLLHDLAAYGAFRDHPADTSDAVVVTPSLLLADALEREGRPFIEIWDYLKGDDVRRAHGECKRLAAAWWRPYFSDILHEGVDIGHAVQSDMWFFFVEALISERIFSRILAEHAPTSFLFFRQEGVPRFWEGAGDRQDVFLAVARWLCERASVETVPLDLPEIEAGGAETKRPVMADTTLPPWPYRDFGGGEKRALFYFTEVDYGKHANLIRDLASGGYACHLLRNTNYPTPLLPETGIIWGNVIDSRTVPDALKAKVREGAARFAASPPQELPHVFANPHLAFQFRGAADLYLRSIRIAGAARLVLDAVSPHLCVNGIDSTGQGVILNRIARQKNIPTLTFPHGSVGSRFYTFERFRSEADHIAVEGPWARDRFVELGRRPESVTVVGTGFGHGARRTGNGAADTVLLMTTIAAPHLATPIASAARLRRSWQALAEEAGKRPHLKFLIKPHPRYDYYPFYEKLVARGPDNLWLAGEVSLEKALSTAAAAVLVGPPSTAALVALAANVPTLQLASADYDSETLESGIEQSGLRQWASAAELFADLDEVLGEALPPAGGLDRLLTIRSPEAVAEASVSLARSLAGESAPAPDPDAVAGLRSVWQVRHHLDADDRDAAAREVATGLIDPRSILAAQATGETP